MDIFITKQRNIAKKVFFITCGLCYRHPIFFKTETKIIKGLIKDDEIRIREVVHSKYVVSK